MEERFVIKRKDFKKLERYAEYIYNTAVVFPSVTGGKYKKPVSKFK